MVDLPSTVEFLEGFAIELKFVICYDGSAHSKYANDRFSHESLYICHLDVH